MRMFVGCLSCWHAFLVRTQGLAKHALKVQDAGGTRKHPLVQLACMRADGLSDGLAFLDKEQTFGNRPRVNGGFIISGMAVPDNTNQPAQDQSTTKARSLPYQGLSPQHTGSKTWLHPLKHWHETTHVLLRLMGDSIVRLTGASLRSPEPPHN